MPHLMSDGVRLAVDVVGDGEPVTVVAHGLTGNRRDLGLVAPFLPGTKVLFDFRGHGDSDRPPPDRYTMEHFAADVDNVARAFEARCAAGVSLGSGATLRLLTHEPDRFDKLVLLLPARMEREGEPRRSLLRMADLLEAHPLEEVADLVVAEEAVLGRFDEFPAARDLRRESILAMNRDGIPAAIRGCIDDPPIRHPEPITRVLAPALVIAQERDSVHDATVARDLAATLPRAELLVFADAHALIRDVPALVAKVSAFLLA